MISFIVPVYNGEPTLRHCIESVLNQGSLDIELILVNDGSTDGSLEICKKYSEKNQKIHVCTQKNQGVSVARNMGLEKACGDWVVFVDADDSIAADYAETVNKYQNSDFDIILFDFFTQGREDGLRRRDRVYEKEEISLMICKMLGEKGVCPELDTPLLSPWAKAYRRSFLFRNNIRFQEGVIMGEDALFNLKGYLHSTKILYVKKAVYYYEINSGSVTQRYLPKIEDSYKILFSYMEQLLQQFPQYKKSFYTYVMHALAIQYRRSVFHIAANKTMEQRVALAKNITQRTLYAEAIRRYEEIKGNFIGAKTKLVMYLIYKRHFNALGFICLTIGKLLKR